MKTIKYHRLLLILPLILLISGCGTLTAKDCDPKTVSSINAHRCASAKEGEGGFDDRTKELEDQHKVIVTEITLTNQETAAIKKKAAKLAANNKKWLREVNRLRRKNSVLKNRMKLINVKTKEQRLQFNQQEKKLAMLDTKLKNAQSGKDITALEIEQLLKENEQRKKTIEQLMQ